MTQEEIISELRKQLAASSDKVISLLAEVRAGREAVVRLTAEREAWKGTAEQLVIQNQHDLAAAALASPSVPPPQDKCNYEERAMLASGESIYCVKPLGHRGNHGYRFADPPAPPVLEEVSKAIADLRDMGKATPVLEEKAAPIGPRCCDLWTVGRGHRSGCPGEKAAQEAGEETAALKEGVADAKIGGDGGVRSLWTASRGEQERAPAPDAAEALMCRDWDPDGMYSCSLPNGHDGPHIAYNEIPLNEWPNDPRGAPPSAPALPGEGVAPTKPLVYLACPYSHADRAVRVRRFEAANVAASALMRDGLKVFSPISHTHPIAEAGGLPLGFDFWEAFDRAYIGHSCKVIVLRADGWRESKGVQAEIRIAAEYGIPVEYIEEQLPKEGSAAAPAPGDAVDALALWHRINQGLCGPVAFRAVLARVRSEEIEACALLVESGLRQWMNDGWIKAARAAASIRARASDATSAGGGE